NPFEANCEKQSKLEDLIKTHGIQCLVFVNSSRSRPSDTESSKMLNSFWWNLLQSHALSALYLQATLQQQQQHGGNQSTIADRSRRLPLPLTTPSLLPSSLASSINDESADETGVNRLSALNRSLLLSRILLKPSLDLGAKTTEEAVAQENSGSTSNRNAA